MTLRFGKSLVLLTDRRLLSWPCQASPGQPPANWQEIPPRPCRSWPMHSIAQMQVRELAGLGTLELLSPTDRLAYWRYTAAASAAPSSLLAEPITHKKGVASVDLNEPETVCPGCGAVLTADQADCPACKPVVGPPVTRSLWRIIRFAKPRPAWCSWLRVHAGQHVGRPGAAVSHHSAD